MKPHRCFQTASRPTSLPRRRRSGLFWLPTRRRSFRTLALRPPGIWGRGDVFLKMLPTLLRKATVRLHRWRPLSFCDLSRRQCRRGRRPGAPVRGALQGLFRQRPRANDFPRLRARCGKGPGAGREPRALIPLRRGARCGRVDGRALDACRRAGRSADVAHHDAADRPGVHDLGRGGAARLGLCRRTPARRGTRTLCVRWSLQT